MRSRWTWMMVGMLAGGCALVREPAPPPVHDGVQVGVASWYGPGFHGNRTANGEIFDQYELTAAHPSLPLGTRVMVTNLTNGRSVEVRVNDRGPFVDGRAIDLSYAAARTIQMIGPGTARVRIEVLDQMPRLATRTVREIAPPPPEIVPPPPPPRRAPLPAEPMGSYAVEVAALTDGTRAEHLRGVLALRFPDAFVSRLGGAAGEYYRVRIGPYPSRTHALARAERVSRLGYPAIIVEDAAP